VLSAWACAAQAAATRILINSWFSERGYPAQVKTITDYLEARGFHRGADFTVEFHQVRTQDAFDRLLGAGEGKIVVSNGSENAEFAFANRTPAPHVFSVYSDPVERGWIESYVKPGGNATGVVEYVDAHAKRLQILAQLMPEARRLAILSSGAAEQPDLRRASEQLSIVSGIEVTFIHVRPSETPSQVARRLREARAQMAYVPLSVNDAFEVVGESIYGAIRTLRIPSVAERQFEILRGKGLLALQVDRSEVDTRIADAIALILNGARAGDIPVHSPRRFMLTVNLDVARDLSIVVPRALLRQASRVISDGR
jgi:putative tryptophan/tyrosine transport system substrate-binding protein